MISNEQVIRRQVTRFAVMLRYEVDEPEMRTYLKALGEVPSEVILEAGDELLLQQASLPRTKRYPPTVADWIAACDAVIKKKRQHLAREAQAMRLECNICHGTGWRNLESGCNNVTRCECVQRAVAHMSQAPRQLAAATTSVDDEAL
jgi:hypothetical protein